MTGLRVQRTRTVMVGPTSSSHDFVRSAVLATITAAWALLLIGQLTGLAGVHEHASAATALSPLVAPAAFLGSWLVMVAATMLPASLPSIQAAAVASHRLIRRRPSTTAFLAGFVSVWMVIGLLAFAAVQALTRLDVATPWLASRPWLLQASAIALAGAYQLTAFKRRSLSACRHPDPRLAEVPSGQATFYAVGIRHGLACLGSAWALMAVMVVAGLGDLWWMAALAGVMVYEATGRHGPRLAAVVGVLLLWLSALVLLPAWLPA